MSAAVSPVPVMSDNDVNGDGSVCDVNTCPFTAGYSGDGLSGGCSDIECTDLSDECNSVSDCACHSGYEKNEENNHMC